jgi:lipopolysaccharide heptosyltransferase II
MNWERWSKAGRLLCVRLDAMGDVLMTTPAIRALAESTPGREITLLTSPSGVEAAAMVPEIDRTIVYDAPWMKATLSRTSSRPETAMISRLRRERFDGAVIFTVYSQSPLPAAMLCYLADIPLRLAHCHENPYQLLTDWEPDPEPAEFFRHEVRRQLDLVASIHCRPAHERLSLTVPEASHLRTLELLDRVGLDRERPWVVCHPGATAFSRRYPAEGYAEIARRLVLDLGWQVLFTGTKSECDLVRGIRDAMGMASLSLVGQLRLPELAAVLRLAPLLIANNTGPVHVAAAVGTPVVDLYALTNPQHTPWGVPCRVLSHDVPCKYCYKGTCPQGHNDCLRLVTPEQVVDAARELFDETNASKTVEPLVV